jgi:hypothetical protein
LQAASIAAAPWMYLVVPRKWNCMTTEMIAQAKFDYKGLDVTGFISDISLFAIV